MSELILAPEVMQCIDDVHQMLADGVLTKQRAYGLLLDVIDRQPVEVRDVVLKYLRRSERDIDRHAATLYGLEEDVA